MSTAIPTETMMKRFPSCRSLKHLNLRPKLILAFLAIAAMAGLCGVAGLVFINRITATVSVFADVTSPLLTQSVALIENAQRSRSLFLAAIEKGEDVDQFTKKFPEIHLENHEHIDTLRSLSALAGINLQIDVLDQREEAFVETLTATIKAVAREHSASAAAQDRLGTFEAGYHKLQRFLIALADRADGIMMKAEDETKVQIQTGAATVDGLGDRMSDVLNGTYPVVQNLNKLLRELEEMEDTVRWVMQATPDQLLSIEEKFKSSFRRVSSISRRLGGRLREADATAILATLQRDFAGIENTILSADGLLQDRHNAATASADIAIGRQSIDQNERAYFAVLDNVGKAVRELNQTAKARTSAEIAQARAVTSIGILFTIVAATLFSLFFAHRLTKPLIGLTAQVSNIRASGELKALPEKSVAGHSDEIGTLSHSFNLMIADLAAAREQLAAKSEAEINRQYERLDMAINSMPQGLCMFDADQNLIITNKRYSDIYGLRPEQTAPGANLRAILANKEALSMDADYAKILSDDRMNAIASGRPWHHVYELRDGRAIAISHLPLPNGGSIVTHEDITERRKSEAKITYMAHHDMLTDLPNRVQFRDDMRHALDAMREKPVAILCLDLDFFKNVNDTLGHPLGDALLKAVAIRLRSCLRPTDKIARLGGDEFAVIQVSADQPFASTALAGRLIKELSEPFAVEDHQVVIGASVGISLAPNDGNDADHLLKNADMALYRAKEDGRATYRFFEPEMDARIQAKRTLEIDLRKALVMGEFELYYQPLIKIDTGAVSACEALLRWHHPERGLVSPAEFIPLAEEIGLINQIGAWALKQACAEAKRWPNDIKVSVNLSPVQFKSGTLLLDVITALGASGLPAKRLELEITESVLLNETDSTLATLNELRDLGVRISMDDFGTGYSSLGYLRKFPFDKIKIDQSFIRDISTTPDSIAIIRAVVGLGNTLGITTTAEGVETEAQLQQIKREGCTEGQGFLFSKPKTAADIKHMLEQGPPGSKAVA